MFAYGSCEMISFKPQTFRLDEFLNHEQNISMVKDTIQIPEIVVTPRGKPINITNTIAEVKKHIGILITILL